MTNEAKHVMSRAHIEALISAAEKELPIEARKAEFVARVRFLHYTAHIEAGFSPEDALYLCTEATKLP